MREEKADLSRLQEIIGYTFRDRQLLSCALTHPSHSKDSVRHSHYQRLEFLGDAVLGMVLAEQLFSELPEEREGLLTKYRSMLVKGEQLCDIARELSLGDYLMLGEAEDAQGGRDRSSILEDALEAVFAAVYLDGGLDAARQTIRKVYGDLQTRLEEQMIRHNPKGKLQEHFQPKLGNEAISYQVVESTGPDHLREFTVEVWVDGSCLGRGVGNSKKSAEEEAARVALDNLEHK